MQTLLGTILGSLLPGCSFLFGPKSCVSLPFGEESTNIWPGSGPNSFALVTCVYPPYPWPLLSHAAITVQEEHITADLLERQQFITLQTKWSQSLTSMESRYLR